MSFLYPVAWLGLLSIPAILVIHALYQKKKRQSVSTLFLIQELSPHSPHGIRLKQLIQNRSLWLQILALCLALWLALGARWSQSSSLKKVAVVMDSSMSMQAFYHKLPDVLDKALSDLKFDSGDCQWHLLSSHLEDPLVFKGASKSMLYQKLNNSLFFRGLHDAQPALDAARRLVGESGEVFLVTDHEMDFSGHVHLISLGEPVQNVGFAGSSVELNADGSWEWNVLIHNPNTATVQRSLLLPKQPPRKFTLNPNEIKSFIGLFPEEGNWLRLKLSHDRFDVDDEITLVRPQLKPCLVALDGSLKESAQLKSHLKKVYAKTQFVDLEQAQLVFGQERDRHRPVNRVCFYPAGQSVTNSLLSCMNQNHELVRNLSWQKFSMLLDQLGTAKIQPGDQVLVWYEHQPLVFKRIVYDAENDELMQELHCNFEYSDRYWEIPAFSILMYRYVVSLLNEMPGTEAKNIALPAVIKYKPEQISEIELVWNEQERETFQLKNRDTHLISVQSNKKTLEIEREGKVVRSYAFQSVDAREGDFRKASSKTVLKEPSRKAEQASSIREDPYIPVWIFIMGSALLYDWSLRRRRF